MSKFCVGGDASDSNRRARLGAFLAAFSLAIASMSLGHGTVAAAGQDFAATTSCTYRVSGFQDWGKAAASNRDLESCAYLKVQLSYGGLFYGWTTTAGPTLTDYLKVNAGYYDWKAAGGAVSNNSYLWNYICNDSYC